MSSPIVRINFCKCGRNLYGTSVRMGFKDCSSCRRTAKYVAEKAVQVPLGRHVGEFIHKRLSA